MLARLDGHEMNKQLHILHLEDEPDFAELVRSLFEQDQLDADGDVRRRPPVVCAATGAGPFDIIISDYHLPSFTGLEAMAMARKQCPHTPFILVSGTIGEQAAIESLKAGATDYRPQAAAGPAALRRAPRREGGRGKRQAAGGGDRTGPAGKVFPHPHGKFARHPLHHQPRGERASTPARR